MSLRNFSESVKNPRIHESSVVKVCQSFKFCISDYDKVPWKLRSVSEIHICMKSIKCKAGKKKQNQSLELTFSSSINREFERK